jgi:hypothetical protein
VVLTKWSNCTVEPRLDLFIETHRKIETLYSCERECHKRYEQTVPLSPRIYTKLDTKVPRLAQFP